MTSRTQRKSKIDYAIGVSRLSHAYIIESVDKQARFEEAMNAAQKIMCEKKTACGVCHTCAQILASSHPDLIVVTHEKPQTLSVREIREQVCDTVTVRPFSNEKKIYIIDDAQLMPPGAQNALLKTIEEPPEYAIIFLLVDNVNRLLETIRSRCTTIRLSADDLFKLDAETYAENIEILGRLGDMDMSDIKSFVRTLSARGAKGTEEFLDFALAWLRDVLVLKQNGRGAELIFENEENIIADRAGRIDVTEINEAIKAVDEAKTRVKFNVNTELTLELLLLSFGQKG